MVAPFRSMGKKRALLIAIRSVLGAEFCDLPTLNFAHRDAKELHGHLINAYGYQPDDIILMIDDVHHPNEFWPTHHRILHQIDQLTHDVPEDCHFFFYFSGHGLEERCRGRASARADGQEEEIVTADGKPILDYILHDRLITPLEKVKGSTLFALFDCCHSETLLDLQRGKGPNRYSREWNIGRDQLFKAVSVSIVAFLQLNEGHRQTDSSLAPRRRISNWDGEPIPKSREVAELSVICLSACRDWQFAHDDCERKVTFTKCFMDAMSQNPDIPWMKLHDKLKTLVSQIQAHYGDWTQEPRISTNFHADLTEAVTKIF